MKHFPHCIYNFSFNLLSAPNVTEAVLVWGALGVGGRCMHSCSAVCEMGEPKPSPLASEAAIQRETVPLSQDASLPHVT